MNRQTATFEAIRASYALTQSGTPRQISERVWHLPTDDGGVAVKLYAIDQASRAHKETAVLAHLQAHNDARFRVQTLRRTAAGETAWTNCDAHAMLTRWEAGQFRSYDTFTPAEWSALGASLAALHLSLERLHLPAPDTIHARLAAIDADDIHRSLQEAYDRPPSNDSTHVRTYVDA